MTDSIDDVANVKLSGCSLAMLFGIISPKIKTRIVIIRVDIAIPASPKKCVKRTVLIEADAILTILFPINIADRALS